MRADSVIGERPRCARGCLNRWPRHGSYSRYARPRGQERVAGQRYGGPDCGLTISVLPADRLPYRSVEGPRLQGFLDEQAGIRSGPDPPPDVLEAGALRRAWTRFQSRVSTLKEAFGPLIPRTVCGAGRLWPQMRLAKQTRAGLLRFLGASGKISLVGDYRCLRVPPSVGGRLGRGRWGSGNGACHPTQR
jgi:hypothetical protein